MSASKSCCLCKKSLPLTSFGKNRSKGDGLHNRCKLCENAREKRPSEKRRLGHIRRQRAYELAHPEKQDARKAVQRAIKRGELTRSACEVCGEPDTHAHHDDYARPLEVRWLCHSHHVEAHHGKLPIAAASMAGASQ